MVNNVDHIGFAVKNLDEAIKLYVNVLGIKCVRKEEVKDQKVKIAFLSIGDTELELLESIDKDGPVARYIDKKGEGIQHIAFRVDDLVAAIAECKENGIKLIDEKPRYGAGGAKVAFLHPKSTFGVLIELLERD